MHTQALQANSSNITLPLNQSVQQSNGAQFALMLSLLFESRGQQVQQTALSAAPLQAVSAAPVSPVISQQDFNLETSLTRALTNNQAHHFNLLHSLYAEHSIAIDQAGQKNGFAHLDVTGGVLQEIQQGQPPANAVLANEAEKISFAS